MKTHDASIFRKSELGPEYDLSDIRPSETVLFGELSYLKAFKIFNKEVEESFRIIVIEDNNLLSESGKRYVRR
jgi:hypothetical protein